MSGDSTRVCPSCHIRHRVPPPSWATPYNSMEVDVKTIRFLMRAAVFFDMEADEPHTAREFVEWLLPDMRGKPSYPEFDGIKKMEGGGKNGSLTTRHASPDPLPMVPRSLRRLVS